jgi:hyperosmotically inducible periplasmic protein
LDSIKLMNRRLTMTLNRFACSAVVAVALFGGCRREEARVETPPAPAEQSAGAQQSTTATADGSTDASRTASQALDDATITARVKTALMAADDVKGLAIDVDTSQGTVRLTGTVETSTQSERAEQIARSADGVQHVQNQLAVKPAS